MIALQLDLGWIVVVFLPRPMQKILVFIEDYYPLSTVGG